MNIGILGAGNIGGTLARKLAAAGHTVQVGVRDPQSAKAQAIGGAGLATVSLTEAAAFGDVLILALPFGAAREVLGELGDLGARILVDATNSFAGPPEGYPSAIAAIADWSGCKRLVKAFNATPWEALADPVYGGQQVETYVCGDDPEAKGLVMQLAKDIGLAPIDAGSLANGIHTEHFAQFWGVLAYQAGLGRDFAFKIVKR